MPRSWHDRHAANIIEDEETRAIYRSIVADKKPYFMRYIYPQLMKQYNTYIKNTDRNALREFQMTVDELKAIRAEDLTDRQRDFLQYFEFRMPVGTGGCVMNKICQRFEDKFDGYVAKNVDRGFDYTIMKSGAQYTTYQYNQIRSLYLDYNKRLKSYASFAERDRVDAQEFAASIQVMQDEFRSDCHKACPDRFVLCDIVLDICYSRNATKKFAWSMCGAEIIENLMKCNNNTISWPEACDDGDIYYGGNRYKVREMRINDEVIE